MSDERLQRILDTLEQSAQGAREARSGVAGDDELGRIGAAIDVMLLRQQVLGQANLDLETRVAGHGAELEAAHRELESFCYSVSHDLKAPLRGVDGYARILMEDYGRQLDDDGRRLLANLAKCAAQMNRLLGDLVDQARLERRVLAIADVDLQTVAEKALVGLGEQSAAVTVDMGGLAARADPEVLAMVLAELLDNAFKFHLPDEVPRIHVSASAAGPATTIEVRDHGIGFDMKHHDRIFGMFQRLHAAEDYPGTGAGLTFVKRAVARMGGRVDATGVPGEGACFCVELPSR